MNTGLVISIISIAVTAVIGIFQIVLSIKHKNLTKEHNSIRKEIEVLNNQITINNKHEQTIGIIGNTCAEISNVKMGYINNSNQ